MTSSDELYELLKDLYPEGTPKEYITKIEGRVNTDKRRELMNEQQKKYSYYKIETISTDMLSAWNSRINSLEAYIRINHEELPQNEVKDMMESVRSYAYSSIKNKVQKMNDKYVETEINYIKKLFDEHGLFLWVTGKRFFYEKH